MTTHLLQADIDMRNLARWAALEKHSDADRSLHCLVYHTFGQNVPRAFAAIPDREEPSSHGKLLAYSSLEQRELREIARSNQSHLTAAIMNPFTFRTTPLPEAWPEGATVGFRVRIMPTYRNSTRSGQAAGEHDIQLRADPGQPKERTYALWLADLLRRKAGAEPDLDSIRMTRCASRKFKRQNSQRWAHGPDATMTGVCAVRDPELWENALRYGIGRHKTYGYGMILIRTANG